MRKNDRSLGCWAICIAIVLYFAVPALANQNTAIGVIAVLLAVAMIVGTMAAGWAQLDLYKKQDEEGDPNLPEF